MAVQKRIFVCGATGRQGGSVAFSLLSKRQRVKALTRHPENARELARLGAEVVQGSFEDKGTLTKAIIGERVLLIPAGPQGVDGVFLMGTPYENGVQAEVEEAKSVIDVCRQDKNIHIVYSSVGSANKKTGIPHFESKLEIEKHLKAGDNPWTILRPVFFMENFESDPLLRGVNEGVVRMPVNPDKPLQMISVVDIGEFAALAFINPEDFVGKEIDLAADELTLPETCRRISRVVGREVRYEKIPDGQVEPMLGRDLALMYRWFNEKGYDVDIAALRRDWNIPLMDFNHYLGRSSFAVPKAA
jgi:uncharacterized protein YbjT (DUF2867 family)